MSQKQAYTDPAIFTRRKRWPPGPRSDLRYSSNNPFLAIHGEARKARIKPEWHPEGSSLEQDQVEKFVHYHAQCIKIYFPHLLKQLRVYTVLEKYDDSDELKLLTGKIRVDEVKDELIMKICEHIKDQKNRSLMCQEDSSECRTAQFILESIFDKMEIYYYKEYVTSPSFAYSSDSEEDIDAEYGDEKEGLSKQDFILKKRGDKVREKLVNHRTLFSKVFPNYTNTPAQPDQRSISDVVDTMIYQALLLRKDTPYATLQRAVVYFSTLLDEESALEAHIQKRSNMMKLVIEFCEISRRNIDHLEAGNDVLRRLRELMQGTSTTVVIREIDNILENKIEPTPNVFTRLVRQCNASLPLPSPLRGGYSEDNKQSVLLSPTKENNKVEA